ncbi:MAG: response regulator [Lachnospiraceae bacterium]|nr:response regulator [Lachnospiraceae bacterium]
MEDRGFSREELHNIFKYSREVFTRRMLLVLITMAAAIGINVYGRAVIDGQLYFLFSLDSLGTIFVAATCSYMPALLTVVISHFIFGIITENAIYGALGHLIGAILISLLTRKRWLNQTSKILLMTFVYSIVTGAVNYCFIMATNGEVKDMPGMLLRFAGSLFPAAAVLFLTALFLRKAPRKLVMLYPNGFFYRLSFADDKKKAGLDLDEIRELKKHRELNIPGLRKRSLSTKITILIAIVAAVLCCCAVTISNFLYSDLSNEYLDKILKGNEIVHDLSGDNIKPPGFDQGNADTDDKAPFKNIRRAFDIQGNLAFDFRLLILLSLVATFVSLIANIYAQYKIARPINRISEAMQSFAFGSEEDSETNAKKIHELNIHTGDEIEELYKALDKTSSDMNEYMRRVNDERQLEAELKVAQASSEAKSSFLSNMSHEIRTPINAVLGMDEMILRETEDPAIIEYASNLRDAGKTLLGLVNDILDFSKIEAGKLEIIPVEYDLSSVINDLVNMVFAKAQDKGLELIVDVDETMPHYLYGDEIRLKQVILNILTNAVKYTEKGSIHLKIGYEKTDEENIAMNISVRDTGIGIKEEDLKKLYSPFERIEEERNRTIEGTGLGMSIVKQLLSLMDSSLQVDSVYGEGSDFYFTVSQRVVNWAPIGDYTERLREAHSSQIQYREAFRAPDARILVVDDTPMNLTVIKGYLKKTLIQIDTAESGQETLKKVKEVKYDCIFLDHRMPVMDGVETFRNMKTLEGNLNLETPVVALTANAISGARESYMEEGFTDYLSKPVDPIRLERLLMDLLPADSYETYRVEEKNKHRDAEDADNKEAAEEAADDGGIPSVEGTDRREALKASGSPEVLRQVMEQFVRTIPKKEALIRSLWKDGDIRNYTIEVHALKSSARLIGALELSKLALELENAGNENDIEKINAKTEALLYDYNTFRKSLAFLVKDDAIEGTGRELIDEDKLREGLEALKEVVEAFDFDSADMCVAELDKYEMPREFKDDFEELKLRLTEVDSDGVLDILKKYGV